MAGEIDPIGARKDGLDAFLAEKLAQGFTIETRTDTHAIIFRRRKACGGSRAATTQVASWWRSTRTPA